MTIERNPNSVFAGKKIGILGKGGSGKSTITVILAGALRRAGNDVCVMDADSTNVGLPEALGLGHPPRPLIDFFGGMVFSGGSVTCPVDDPTPLARSSISLETLPRQYVVHTSDGIHVLVAGKMGERGPGAGCDGPIAKIARDVTISGEDEDPVTLVDFKAGFEDTARGALTGLDWALVVVDPTAAAIQMAIHMQSLIESLRQGALPATEHLESRELVELANSIYRRARIKGSLVVLNKVPDRRTETYMRQRLAPSGIDPIAVIHEDRTITPSWLTGVPIDGPVLRADAARIVGALQAIEQSGIGPEKRASLEPF